MYCCRLLAIAAPPPTYNAALNQPAFMSSKHQSYVATLANDGDHSTSYTVCATTTENDPNPWWAVDLGVPSTVVEVKYTVIGDPAYGI